MNCTSELQALRAMKQELDGIERCDSEIDALNRQIKSAQSDSEKHGVNRPDVKNRKTKEDLFKTRKEKKVKNGIRLMRIIYAALSISVLTCIWKIVVRVMKIDRAYDDMEMFFIIGSISIVVLMFGFLSSIEIPIGWKIFLIIEFIPPVLLMLYYSMWYSWYSIRYPYRCPIRYCWISGLITIAYVVLNIIFRIIAHKLRKNGTSYTKEEELQLRRATAQDNAELDAYAAKTNAILESKYKVYLEKKRMCDEKILAWGKKRLEHLQKLQEIPGLASQDKNSATVGTLISYLERGRADSIKEALNLYIVEQREISRAVSARIAQENLRDAIKRQEEENNRRLKAMSAAQEEHNRKMRELAEENARKVDKAIEDIKKGNH